MYISLAVKEMQIKTVLRFYLTPVRLSITKKTTNAGKGNGVWGKRSHHIVLVEM
jgi:hypothetical protein